MGSREGVDGEALGTRGFAELMTRTRTRKRNDRLRRRICAAEASPSAELAAPIGDCNGGERPEDADDSDSTRLGRSGGVPGHRRQGGGQMELGCVSPAGGRDVLLRTAVPAHQACAILQNHGLAVQRGSALW